MQDPIWLEVARKYVGQKEIKGPHHNPNILRWWDSVAPSINDDETPWCGAYTGGIMIESKLPAQPGGAMARNWRHYGKKLTRPAYGCIVVFWRGSPKGSSGHVGFVVGVDKRGNLMVLGGNQGDQVSIKPFPLNRVLAYRWPGIWPAAERFKLPVLNSDGKLSTNEA